MDWKFYEGPQVVELAVGVEFESVSSAEVMCTSMLNQERRALLGPFRQGEKQLRARLLDTDTVSVQCAPDCVWQLRWWPLVPRADVLDQTPVSMPVPRGRSALSQEARMRELIRQELSAQAEVDGNETFEESEDFEIEDGEVLFSAHELTEEQLDAELDAQSNLPMEDPKDDRGRTEGESVSGAAAPADTAGVRPEGEKGGASSASRDDG